MYNSAVCMYVCILVYVSMHAATEIHTYTHAYIACMYVCMQQLNISVRAAHHMSTHILLNAYTFIYVFTHTCMCISLLACCMSQHILSRAPFATQMSVPEMKSVCNLLTRVCVYVCMLIYV